MICKQIYKRLKHGYQVAGLNVGWIKRNRCMIGLSSLLSNCQIKGKESRHDLLSIFAFPLSAPPDQCLFNFLFTNPVEFKISN
jgi:hypothetical protein